MATDVQLSPDIRLSSFPCWERATAAEALAARWTARNILQPVIDRWGPIHISSWTRWRADGCARARTGDHADGGTVDFVPVHADVATVWRWMGPNLAGRYGSLINERDHIHVTRPGVGVAPGAVEFLNEPTEGVYIPARLGLPTPVLAALLGLALYLWGRGR